MSNAESLDSTTHQDVPDEGPVVRAAIASTMRRTRMQRGMSLRDLSASTGLSTALLSQIERETANPTVAALTRIATEIGRAHV
mgnify:CR=1 FL=1